MTDWYEDVDTAVRAEVAAYDAYIKEARGDLTRGRISPTKVDKARKAWHRLLDARIKVAKQFGQSTEVMVDYYHERYIRTLQSRKAKRGS